jgi:hypothetical protein
MTWFALTLWRNCKSSDLIKVSVTQSVTHTRPQSGPHHRNPTRRWFTGFAEAILRRCRHLNPSNNNSLDWIHPDCVCLTCTTMRLKIRRAVTSASTIQVLGFPCRHPECNYILVNRNHAHPHTHHPTLTTNVTTSVLFRIKYYQIGPKSTMRFLATAIVLFHIVIINGGHFVTTTIMHSRIFKLETMDNSTAASGRRGYKHLPNRGQNPIR